ncbi:Zinc finger X-linked protein ZXDB [Hondaea fermentalgiana]|uniref:Zinc finger X-linked protein ZXDB n=1 Tax=Hondaea fermentalgiana TaxID=2315210 RepID=A0A2R5GRP0_9STRA|nr:Zinc finger X-linked protein ZXDB [Hondaea fermentalgiana]|eukprot:GBG33547.1 Zinc finger X-linked protein ZXDB [Hondaea fermentalgiana]
MARPTPTHRSPSQYCKVEGCTRYPQRKGLCRTHGCPRRPLCRIEGCDSESQSAKKGLCQRHDPDRITCKVEGCSRMKQRRGFCHRHLGTRHECQADGCIQFVDSSGQCPKHGRFRSPICRTCGIRQAVKDHTCNRCRAGLSEDVLAPSVANERIRSDHLLTALARGPAPRRDELASAAPASLENAPWQLLKRRDGAI